MELRSYIDTDAGKEPKHHPGGTDTLNPLLEMVDAALASSPATAGRLGCLVSNCYIDGKVMTDPAISMGDGVAGNR